jgi:drug/metabolite transporter (DMT)-like permease
MPLAGGQRYITSTAVFLNEVLKLGVCLSIALYDLSRNLSPSSTAASLFSTLITAVFTGDSWKLAIPALLYTLQNSLQYVAISNLDVATLQVTYQFKIIPTAIFSILLLRRSISGRKWVALVLLVFGVAIVQIPAARSGSLNLVKDMQSRIYFPRSADDLRNLGGLITAPLHKRSATYDGMHEDLLLSQPNQNKALGLVAAICSCTASALGSVFFEKILKESHTNVSIWVRNVQLAVYSIFPALFIGVIFVDGELVAKSGFLVGYNWVVWTTITFQALGGILVALCVHYADNIAKTFATSISILLSLVFSILFFGFALTSNVSEP